jgi:hypothetical protein
MNLPTDFGAPDALDCIAGEVLAVLWHSLWQALREAGGLDDRPVPPGDRPAAG